MRKLLAVALAVLLFMPPLPVKAQSPQTVTWTDMAGIAGACLKVTTDVPGDYYYCPYQSTSYAQAYCPSPQTGQCYGSLYLPGFELEAITTTWGQPYNILRDGKGRVARYDRTDTLVENQEGNGPVTWSGSVTQSFSVSYGAYSYKCRCYPAVTSVLIDGSGTLTAAQ